MATEPSTPTKPSLPAQDSTQIFDAPVADHASDAHMFLSPVTKLDADNYMADDMDGITESLFGSGNLNYLLLQSRQTDAAATGNGFDGVVAGDAEAISALAALAQAGRSFGDAQDLENSLAAGNSGDAGAGAGTRGLASNGGSGADSSGSRGDNFAAANKIVSDFPDIPPEDTPPDITDAPDDPDGPDDPDDPDGPDNPDDPDDPDGPDNPNDPPVNNDDIDILGDNNIGLPVVDINLDPLEDIVGDIDLGIGITHGDDGLTIDPDIVLLDIPILDTPINIDIPLLNPVIGTVLDVVDPILTPVTGIVQPVLDGVSDTVESLLGSLLGAPPPAGGDIDLAVHTDLGIPNIDVNLDVVENIVGDIDILAEFSHGADGMGVGLDTIVADLPLANADLHLDVPLVMPAVNGALDPVTELLGDITSPDTLAALVDNPFDTAHDIIGDVVETVANSVEGTLNGLVEGLADGLAGIGQAPVGVDTDIDIGNNLGVPQVDIVLDTVESITGDIDVGADVTYGDEGITVALDTVLAGIPLVDTELTVDIPLVTPVVGDLLNVAQDILGQAGSDADCADGALGILDGVTQGVEDMASALLGGQNGGDGDASWPQLDVGGVLSGVTEGIGNLLGGGDNAIDLPEPIGSITEGLGILSSGNDHGGGLLSGLLNGHGGGLFG